MEIKVQIKTIYGVDQVYPACPKAVIFAKMLGTKTLTHSALCHIESLGYTITPVAPAYLRAA